MPLRLRLVPVGVKVHGKRNYAFLVDSTVPGGGNLMIEILRQVLNDLDEKNELPTKNPKFYLQVDNCGENKNKTLFAFLVDLVNQGSCFLSYSIFSFILIFSFNYLEGE